MARGDTDKCKDLNDSRSNQAALLLQAETLRPKLHHRESYEDKAPAKPSSESGMSTFWRVFGGTILSIIVLICITVCNQFSTSLSDLRRDLNQQSEARADFVKKADLDRAVSTLWTGMKEGRVATSILDNVTDKTKSLEQQLDRQAKSTSDDHKELKAQIDDQRKSFQEDGKDTVKKVEDLRKTLDEERKEFQRKLEEQRKAADEERKELTGKLQTLAERLAAVESVQNASKSIPVPAVAPAGKKPVVIESDLP